MKTKTIIATLLLSAVVFFTNCSKPKDGINGKDGATGMTGTTGATGPTGATGNANVVNYSITVTPSQWTYDNLYKRWYYRYYTNDNSQSAVLGYVISGSGKQAIPYYESASDFQIDMATYLFGTPPYIEFQYSNFASLTTAPSFDKYFYLVILPPALKKANPNVNWNNYNEVKATFNLAD